MNKLLGPIISAIIGGVATVWVGIDFSLNSQEIGCHLVGILGAVSLLIGGLVFLAGHSSSLVELTQDDAKAALDRMTDWAKWLVALQVSSMGVVGVAYRVEFADSNNQMVKMLGLLAVSFLGMSVYCFTWVLAAMPSIQQRLKAPGGRLTTDNDIYEKPIFANTKSLKLQVAAGWSHFLGIAGFICLALFFIVGILEVKPNEPKKVALPDEQVEALNVLAEALKKK